MLKLVPNSITGAGRGGGGGGDGWREPWKVGGCDEKARNKGLQRCG